MTTETLAHHPGARLLRRRSTTSLGILQPAYRSVTVGALALVSLTAFEALAVTTAMPAIVESLNGLSMYALAFGAPLATSIIGLVLGGSWSDARGPATSVRLGAGLFTVGLLLAGFAVSMPMLLVGRAVQGLGTGLLNVALLVVVGRCFPERLRPRVLAGFAAAWVVPSIVGPAVSGMLVEQAGWRWVFLSVALMAPLAAAPVLLRLRQTSDAGGAASTSSTASPSSTNRRLSWAVAAGVGVALLQVAGQGRGFAAGIVALVGAVLLAPSAPRLLPAGTFRLVRGAPTVMALRGAAAAAFVGAQVFLPLLLIRERGLSPTTAGIALTTGSIAWFTGSWLQGRLPEPALRPTLLRIGMWSIATGVGTAIGVVLTTGPIAILIAGWAAVGGGMGIVVPVLSLLAFDLAEPGQQGVMSASLAISDALFSTVALTVAGATFSVLLGVSATAPFLAGFAVAATVASLGALVAARVQSHSRGG
jgi:MFS family permease